LSAHINESQIAGNGDGFIRGTKTLSARSLASGIGSIATTGDAPTIFRS
jgi:hypothetical protein